MAIDLQPGVDAAFVASRVPYKDGIYVVGPFAARVSFASQQRRAINLVWSINEDLKRSGQATGLQNKEVAVVGAGLAGLTAALALTALGASVWPIEKQIELLSGMSGASHRDVHPTINFWPQEKLEISTYLPFFNWHHDTCKAVLERIVTEWNRLSKKHRGLLKSVRLGHTVTSFRRNPDDEKWLLTYDAIVEPKLNKQDFDIVVFATGFGKENILPGSDTPGYWDQIKDYIVPIVEASRGGRCNPCDNYVVSGSGDGGVIEVLRLLFKNFRAGTIEENTRPLFADTRLVKRMKYIESVAQKKLLDAALHDGFPVSGTLKDAISNELWAQYAELVSDDEISLDVTTSILGTRSDIPRVILLGERASPLDLSVSPYHKLLLAFSLRRDLVEYYQIVGNARPTPGTGAKVRLAEQYGIKAKNVAFDAIRRFAFDSATNLVQHSSFNETEFTKQGCLFLSRHGYISPLTELFGGRDIPDKIRRTQSLYADQDWLTFEQADEFAKKLGECCPSEKPKWMHKHLPLAEDYFSKNYTHLAVNEQVTSDGEPFYQLQYIGTDLYEDDNLQYPSTFVGTRVDTNPILVLNQANPSGHSA